MHNLILTVRVLETLQEREHILAATARGGREELGKASGHSELYLRPLCLSPVLGQSLVLPSLTSSPNLQP